MVSMEFTLAEGNKRHIGTAATRKWDDNCLVYANRLAYKRPNTTSFSSASAKVIINSR